MWYKLKKIVIYNEYYNIVMKIRKALYLQTNKKSYFPEILSFNKILNIVKCIGCKILLSIIVIIKVIFFLKTNLFKKSIQIN